MMVRPGTLPGPSARGQFAQQFIAKPQERLRHFRALVPDQLVLHRVSGERQFADFQVVLLCNGGRASRLSFTSSEV